MNGHRFVAVVDQGSSSTKGAVLDRDGERLTEISFPVLTESSGSTVHHDAKEIVASVRAVLDHLLDRHDVAAIGLTCQRSTCLLWDRDSGRPLTPALSWQDTSQTEQVERLSLHAERIAALTGLRLSPHYAATKLSSLLDSLDAGRKRAEAGDLVAGTLDAHLVRHLTGIDGTEPGHAGRTLLYDLERGDWSAELAAIFGIPPVALPSLHTSAGDWGSYRGIPLTAVAGDQQAALLGHGGWEEGVTVVHFGTGAFVLTSSGSHPLRHPNALTAVLASTPTTRGFQIEATVNSAGSAVDWARRLSGERLDDWQTRRLDPEAIPLVLPAFRGVGAPWWRSDARAVVSELGLEASAADLLAGTISGVAMRVLDCVELLSSVAPTMVVRASGKLTRLAGLTGLLADAGQIPVEIAADEEVGLLGIGRLAIVGLTGDESALSTPPPAATRREPRWEAGRARRVRDRWTAFAESALRIDRPASRS